MYRRVVSMLLVPCVLLTQSVAPGHAHDGGQPAGHDLRPHFHTQPADAGHGHDPHGHHHHGPGGHHHDDAPEPQPPVAPEPQPDHDSDAVYVAGVDTAPAGRSEAADAADGSQFWEAVAACGPAAWVLAVPRQPVNWSHPPPTAGPCPLYVRHLTLLI